VVLIGGDGEGPGYDEKRNGSKATAKSGKKRPATTRKRKADIVDDIPSKEEEDGEIASGPKKARPKSSKHFSPSAAAATTSNKRQKPNRENEDSSSDSDMDTPIAALAKKKVKPRAKAGKRPSGSRKARAGENGSRNSSSNTNNSSSPANPPDLIVGSETDSDDEKDRPFTVEYAATGRSTCRSCDQRIDKGELRIRSQPLFRGKPGFHVYRHCKCQILPEYIKSMCDVGGWRRLKAEDRAVLQEQVEESKRLIEQENEEMHADELVQAAFQGEIRPSPPGLSASLLPFQQEGVS
jgi:hypothetical protein